MAPNIPFSHPRYISLLNREKVVDGFKKGIVVEEGLIAHGRGEAFDYLLGEKTTIEARLATEAAISALLVAKHPVISINGNAAALCPKEIIALSEVIGAELEINLFYGNNSRILLIKDLLISHGAKNVLDNSIAKNITSIPELNSERRKVNIDGIYKADVVLVPLEDGDRTEALIRLGKKVITIDLNPLSRTAQSATISIIDNIIRCLPLMVETANRLKPMPVEELQHIFEVFDNNRNLKQSLGIIRGSTVKNGKKR